MNTPASNPREKIGGNQEVDHAQIVIDRLALDYAELQRSLADALDQARALPSEVNDEDAQSEYARVIKNLRDLDARVEALRVSEKEPYLRGGNAVDSFFKVMRSKLFRQNKNDKAGAADVLQARVNDYVQRKAAEERRKRDEEAARARAEEERLRRERQEEERKQREAEEKAARARKAQNEEAARQAAAEAEEAAARLRAQEQAARDARRQAEADAAAKTADLVRTRTDSGHTVTAKQVPYVEITDSMKLDVVALWPFVKDDAKLAALKQWARTTGHKKQMDGAIIEMRDEAVIR